MTTSSEPTRGYVVIVNADSGSNDDDAVDAVCDHLADCGPVERRATSEPEDLDEVLRDLDGRTMVVVGGDGSIHAAVQRAHRLDLLGDVTFGLVPMGTGNDLARTLGVPLDPHEAAVVVTSGTPRSLDLLVYGDDDVAVNAIHAGIGADAAERAEPFKERVGAAAYPVGAVAAGMTANGWDVTVEVDGERVAPDDRDRVLMVAIGNGRTIGGGTEICPDADAADGLLDVIVSHATGPAARAAYATAMLRGTHVDRDDVATARGRRVTITGDAIALNVDGELVGEHQDVTIEVRPAAWTLIGPG